MNILFLLEIKKDPKGYLRGGSTNCFFYIRAYIGNREPIEAKKLDFGRLL